MTIPRIRDCETQAFPANDYDYSAEAEERGVNVIMKTIPFEKLSLSNDYIFSKAMRNIGLCKKLLEIILGVEIEAIEYPEEQKVIDEKIDSHSIRLDVYVKDDVHTVYNIEMQSTNPYNLPKRSRYYQSLIDIHLIEKGVDYDKLNKTYIIFICLIDIFKMGRCVYTFKSTCQEDSSIILGNEATIIFINPCGKQDDISTDLRNFLKYLSDETISDEFTKELSKEVDFVRNNEEWRRDLMTLYMRDQENQKIGKEIGKEIGKTSKLVSIIRNLDNSELELAPRILKCDITTIKDILTLVEDNPEANDEEIALSYINQIS